MKIYIDDFVEDQWDFYSYLKIGWGLEKGE